MPRLLDLFCGAGGAAKGYADAGFEVVGVDIKPQPRYPFEFHQADALDPPVELSEFDAIHASPPCQAYSKASAAARNRGKEYPDLIAPTRALLEASGLPFVIENVVGAPLRLDRAVRLCGSAFGLPIKRHRLFESNVPLMSNGCIHGAYPRVYPPAWNRTTKLRWLSISGGYQTEKKGVAVDEHRAAMGIDWMTYNELSLAIPPAYTQFLGEQLMQHLQVAKERR